MKAHYLLAIILTFFSLLPKDLLANRCEAPDVIIMLDRSGSMNSNSKWTHSKNAINSITNKYNGKINFGLFLWTGTCTTYLSSNLNASIGSSPTTIKNVLNSYSPGGQTPMYGAINRAKDLFPNSNKRRYLLLITDGCGCKSVNDLKSITKTALNKGIKTISVGFGSGVCPNQLNGIAQNGGVNSSYYRADSSTALVNSLNSIIKIISQESCDNKDNDCDGKTDENLSQNCSSACGSGQKVCSSGSWGSCSAPLPKTEICDKKDNDCDGKYDEGFKVDNSCYNGIGECKAWGVLTCNSTGGTSCTAKAKSPTKEECDNKDNDCDSKVDEGFPLGKTCQVGVGICKRIGKFVCQNLSGKAVCSVSPGGGMSEMCDGLDNDCDGKTDEGFSLGNTCNVGTGQCKNSGKIVCHSSGQKSVCSVKAKSPSKELCDNKDNDCDKKIDEDFNLNDSCGVGVGECERIGIYICHPNQKGITCSAKPGKPVTELCDAKDNDCDNKTDETFALAKACEVGTGECKNQGKTICDPGGKKTTCNVKPKTSKKEICDGKDNNCNGKSDEGFNLGDACTVGLGICKNSGKLICGQGGQKSICDVSPKGSKNEICDSLDNDCDGKNDETFSLGQKCDVGIGECKRNGKTICHSSGLKVSCDVKAARPKTELCDAKDNDCDNKTDETFNLGKNCEVGIGQCKNLGQTICKKDGSDTTCDVSPKKANQEVCDDLDNDCDGQNDEKISRECATACGKGTETCSTGKFIGCSAPPVLKEICDGIDNNCNSFTDDSAKCNAAGAICLCGECSIPCKRGECPQGFKCNNIGYCVKNPCCGIKCPGNQTCIKGQCKNLCKGVSCLGSEVCIQGSCQKKNCHNDTSLKCSKGSICNSKGLCEKDPCQSVSCQSGQVCVNGNCQTPCNKNILCSTGKTCQNDFCKSNSCGSKNCPKGQICQNNICLSDPCLTLSCPSGQRCVNGKCNFDACKNISCQKDETCSNGKCLKNSAIKNAIKKNSGTSNPSSGTGSSGGTNNGTSTGGANTGTSTGGSTGVNSGSSTGQNTGGNGSNSTGSSSGANSTGNSGNSNNQATAGNNTGGNSNNSGANSSGPESSNSASDQVPEGGAGDEIDSSGCSLKPKQNLNFTWIFGFIFLFLGLRRRCSKLDLGTNN